jgi:hypothetical protein
MGDTMIAIVNVGPFDDEDAGGIRDYEVRINSTVITTFQHKRSDGLAVCLEKASAAVRHDDYLKQVQYLLPSKP